MTRTEKLQHLKQIEKQKTIYTIIVVSLLFATVYSVTYGYMISKENERIKEKINSYNSDVKIYYLKKDIERGNY